MDPASSTSRLYQGPEGAGAGAPRRELREREGGTKCGLTDWQAKPLLLVCLPGCCEWLPPAPSGPPAPSASAAGGTAAHCRQGRAEPRRQQVAGCQLCGTWGMPTSGLLSPCLPASQPAVCHPCGPVAEGAPAKSPSQRCSQVSTEPPVHGPLSRSSPKAPWPAPSQPQPQLPPSPSPHGRAQTPQVPPAALQAAWAAPAAGPRG